MGAQGTIVWQDGISGRQPWTPAAWYRDTLRFGLAAAAVFYYDPMDNYEKTSISQAAGGGWARLGMFTIKGAYEHFSALGMYLEQTGLLSVGLNAFRFVQISIDAELLRACVLDPGEESAIMLYAGETCWFPFRLAAISLSCARIRLAKLSHKGFDLPAIFRCGFHTTANKFGAQGVLLEVIDRRKDVIRFAAGEEYRFTRQFGLCAALSTNPNQMSFGIVFNTPNLGGYAALVNHPALGWSKGFGMDFAK